VAVGGWSPKMRTLIGFPFKSLGRDDPARLFAVQNGKWRSRRRSESPAFCRKEPGVKNCYSACLKNAAAISQLSDCSIAGKKLSLVLRVPLREADDRNLLRAPQPIGQPPPPGSGRLRGRRLSTFQIQASNGGESGGRGGSAYIAGGTGPRTGRRHGPCESLGRAARPRSGAE